MGQSLLHDDVDGALLGGSDVDEDVAAFGDGDGQGQQQLLEFNGPIHFRSQCHETPFYKFVIQVKFTKSLIASAAEKFSYLAFVSLST